MKQRILSVALALCLCISSQPPAHASQEVPSQQEEVSMEDSADEPKSNDDNNTSSDDSSPQEDNSAIESTETPDRNDDDNTTLTEDSSQQDDDSVEESVDEPDSNDDDSIESAEDSSQQENNSDDESVNEPDNSDNENTNPSEDSSLQEDDSTEESAGEPGCNDEHAAPAEDFLQQENNSTEESTEVPDSSDDEKNIDSIEPSEDSLIQEDEDEPVLYADIDAGELPTPTEIYEAMIAFQDTEGYTEGTTWNDNTPYTSSNPYRWKGGTLGGSNIVAVGCAAFAFRLSDAAFGSLPARMYAEGKFTYEDIKVGDILRMNTDTHTVIVLEVDDAGIVVAEGNFSGKVHWGRAISQEEVMNDTSHYITRYPEGYVAPDDPEADVSVAHGTLAGGLNWDLTKAGTLTISGKGAMPDFSSASEQPWSNKSSEIRRIVIENGVTSIGDCAFWECGVLSAKISSSVTTIGNSAFRGSSIIAVDIPSSVKTIGDSAFRECKNLSSVTISEGLETIIQNAFRACTSLTSINLPASIEEVGASAFFECTTMRSAIFSPGNKQVKMGDNIFTRCYCLMSVTLPTSIDRIGEGMFQNCSILAGVEIPEGTESIGGSAFASSGVSVVIVPDSVTTIGTAAFSDCPLTDIYFTGTESKWNGIRKLGDTASAVSKATIHYNYTPTVKPEPGDGNNPSDNPDDTPSDNPGGNPSDNPDSNPGDNPSDTPGSNPSDNPGNTPGDNPGNNPDNTSNNSSNTGSSSSSSGNNSSSSSNNSSSSSSSGGSSTGSKQTENTSTTTDGGQWVVDNTGNAKGTSWKLKASDGTYVTGTVITDTDGNVKEQVAWKQVNGAWYAFGADGYADSGWVMDEATQNWYFVDINSGMQTGWHNDTNDGSTYFMDPVSGKMLVGWNLIEGKWYYFNAFVDTPTWQRDGLFGDWIYTGAETRPFGAMFKNEETPDGYIVDENGAWIG